MLHLYTHTRISAHFLIKHTHTHTHTQTHTHTHTYIHTHFHKHTHTRTGEHTHRHKHKHTIITFHMYTQELYGPTTAGRMLNSFSRVFTAYMQWHGFTCGFDDLLLNAKAEAKRAVRSK